MTRKPRLVAACACLLPFSAMSQSSVTIYGVLDMAARYVSNEGVGRLTSLVSGSNLASRLGFRGREDLGGGLSAGFTLEAGINADTGAFASSAPFERQSHVFLADRRFGEIRLGRDYTPVYTNWGGRFDPFGHVGIGSPGNLLGSTTNGPIRAAFGAGSNTVTNTLTRASNAVQYIAPPWVDGLEFALMAAGREGGAGSDGQHHYRGGRIGYGFGPWTVSGAYSTTRDANMGRDEFKDASYGVVYAVDGVRVTAAVRRMSFRNARQSTGIVALTLKAGPGDLKFSLSRADISGSVAGANVDANDATQLAAGYVYNLSRRTVVYGTVSRIHNAAGSVATLPGGPSGMLAGRNSQGAEFGMRTSF